VTPEPLSSDSPANIDSPAGKGANLPKIAFSNSAIAELEAHSQRYWLALEEVSRSVASNEGLDSVSAIHVRRAAELLGLSSRKKGSWPRELGAMLVGVGLTNLAAVLISASYTFLGAFLISIPLLGGFGLYAYGLARD
jgi:hypothetical protein